MLNGIVTRIPFANYVIRKYYYRSTGGTSSAEYCYSVWMRHLIKARRNGMNEIPKVVAELGPGDSIGIGLSALLSGAEKYYALDILKYGSIEQTLRIFDELISLFENRTPFCQDGNYKNVNPKLENKSFPHYILDEHLLNKSLEKNRLNSIRKDILELNNEKQNPNFIFYYVPWFKNEIIKSESVDFILSQSVLEYFDDPKYTLGQMSKWLKPQGYMSHQIDLACMRTASTWDGHWGYSDFEWKIMKGKRPFFINRLPYSYYNETLAELGLKIIYSQRNEAKSEISRKQLASRFSNLTDDDLSTKGAFILAQKV